MMQELDNVIRELWKIDAKPILISLTLKDSFQLNEECRAQANFSLMVPPSLNDVASYLGIPVYKTRDTNQSNVMAVKDGFLTAFRLNCVDKTETLK